MKKLLSILLVAAIAATTFAQNATELAKQQLQQNAFHMKLLNAKLSKSAKKEAKVLKKEGWTVPAGEKSIAQQITESQLYGEELMTDENGSTTNRFIMQTSAQIAGTYNVGYAAARSAAQREIAAMLKTEIVSAMQSKMENTQISGVPAETIEKFQENSRSIVDGILTNSIPVLAIYRKLPNNNIEVQVRIACDKKEISARLKRNMHKELGIGGDVLDSIIDDAIE